MKKKKKLESKEFYKAKILELEPDSVKIFDKLTNNKTISSLELEFLYNKLERLNVIIANNLENLVEVDNLIVKKMKRYLTLFIIASLLFFPTLFINSLLSLGFGSLWIYSTIKTTKYFTSKQTNSYEEDQEFFKKVERLDIEIDKCYNLIDYINNFRYENANDEEKSFESKKFDIANDIIYLLLNTDEIIKWDEYPQEIKELVINILQNDLVSSEKDITILLNLAKDKIEQIKNSEKFSDNVLNRLKKNM